MVKKIVLAFCLFILIFFPSRILASDEFASSSIVTYDVDSTGLTWVTHDTTLTNKLANVYATGYTMTLEGYRPSNFEGWDQNGKLPINVSTSGQTTNLNLSFNHQSVGLGSKLNFTVKYKLEDDIATQKGQVWEVSVPKQSDSAQSENYTLRLVVAKSFGKAAFVSPTPISVEDGKDSQTFVFNKDQVSGSRIVAAFGLFQVFDFNLSYHLSNTENYIVKTQISIPPDTAYQKVIYKNFIPKPQVIESDSDGNWLATYILEKNQSLTATVTGSVHLFAVPQYTEIMSADSRTRYLTSTDIWPTDDPKIKQLSAIYRDPKSIYDFVSSYLSYNYNRVNPESRRMGALAILESPDKAICTEYTDLFIALARSAGIPTREIQGFAYTTDSKLQPLSLVDDVLHAWPQYWNEDKSQWISIDPTWGSTTGGVDYFSKLDLNHFTFATHGLDVTKPYPAGSYKLDNSEGKDVNIQFGQYGQIPDSQYSISISPNQKIQLPFSWQVATLKINNSGFVALDDITLEDQPDLHIISAKSIDTIPPIGQAVVKVYYNSQQFLPWTRPMTLTFRIGNNNQLFTLPKKDIQLAQILGLSLISIIFIFSVSITSFVISVIINRSKKANLQLPPVLNEGNYQVKN